MRAVLGLVFGVMAAGCATSRVSLCERAECRAWLQCAPGTDPVRCEASRLCEQQVCEGRGWTCGKLEDGSLAWVDAPGETLPCDDLDACTTGDRCTAGSCRGTSAQPGTDCGGICVDTRSDTRNCGGCGVPCDDTTYQFRDCVGGQCVETAHRCTAFSSWTVNPGDACGKDWAGKTYCKYDCAYDASTTLNLFCAAAYGVCVCGTNGAPAQGDIFGYTDLGTCAATCKKPVDFGFCVKPP